MTPWHSFSLRPSTENQRDWIAGLTVHGCKVEKQGERYTVEIEARSFDEAQAKLRAYEADRNPDDYIELPVVWQSDA